MNDDKKSKDELLNEVKKLRQDIEADNKRKKQDSNYNSMIIVGAALIIVSIIAWCWLKGL